MHWNKKGKKGTKLRLERSVVDIGKKESEGCNRYSVEEKRAGDLLLAKKKPQQRARVIELR